MFLLTEMYVNALFMVHDLWHTLKPSVNCSSQPTDCIEQIERCHELLLRFDPPLPRSKILAFLLDGTQQQYSALSYFFITPCLSRIKIASC